MSAHDYWGDPRPGQLRLFHEHHPRNPFRVADLAMAIEVIDVGAVKGFPLVQWRVQRFTDGAWADVAPEELDAARRVPP